MRMELSALNSHRYRYNFISSPICPCCGTHSETNFHYFFKCPTHQIARNRLSFRLESELDIAMENLDTVLDTILLGKNISPQKFKTLPDIVNEYTTSTGRFL